ncbi:hypothetical protein ACF0H5_008443 [Mactra antiquata]
MERHCSNQMNNLRSREYCDEDDETINVSTERVDDLEPLSRDENAVANTDIKCVVNESSKSTDALSNLIASQGSLDLASFEADSPDGLSCIGYLFYEEGGENLLSIGSSFHLQDEVNCDQDFSRVEVNECIPLSFEILSSNIARDLTPRDVEQINFILKDHFKDEITSKPQTGHEILEVLIARGVVHARDVLWLQILCGVICNDSLIHNVFQWARHKGDVLHFDPPVKCSYQWKIDGPLHVAGEPFDQYSESELEDKIKHIKNILLTNTVTKGKSDDRNVRGELWDVSLSPCCMRNLKTGCELIIDPHFNGIGQEENTIPKRIFAEDFQLLREFKLENQNYVKLLKTLEENVAALEEENVRLHETIRQQKDTVFELDEVREELGNLQAKLYDMEKTMGCRKEQLNYVNQETGQGSNITGILHENGEEFEKLRHDYENAKLECEISQRKYEEVNDECEEIKSEKEELVKEFKKILLKNDMLESRICKLDYDIELLEASLGNEKNLEHRKDFSKKLEYICGYSLSVRKAVTSFDPASFIPPPTSETFKQSFTYKICRLYPQILSR